MRNRVREVAGLGRTLINEPRAFPGELVRVTKRSIRTLWNARGGGLYACGFVVTFIWLEITTIAGEIAESDSALAFLSEQLFEMFFRLVSESFVNSLLSFIWPVYLMQWSPLWGALLLVVLYFTFTRFLKEPLTHWLFDDEEDAPIS